MSSEYSREHSELTLSESEVEHGPSEAVVAIDKPGDQVYQGEQAEETG